MLRELQSDRFSRMKLLSINVGCEMFMQFGLFCVTVQPRYIEGLPSELTSYFSSIISWNSSSRIFDGAFIRKSSMVVTSRTGPAGVLFVKIHGSDGAGVYFVIRGVFQTFVVYF